MTAILEVLKRKWAEYILEILVIIIGILGAFALDSWSEERKTQSQLVAHLKNLVDDLEDDVTEYINQYQVQHARFHSFVYLLKLADSSWGTYDSLPALSETRKQWSHLFPYPDTANYEFIEFGFNWMDHGFVSTQVSRTAVEEIKNQGLFSLITNNHLKKQVNEYYKYIDWVFGDAIIIHYQTEAQELGKYLRDTYGMINTDMSSISDPIEFLRQHEDVRLKLRSVINDTYYHALEMTRSRKKAEGLIQAIKLEIAPNDS